MYQYVYAPVVFIGIGVIIFLLTGRLEHQSKNDRNPFHTKK